MPTFPTDPSGQPPASAPVPSAAREGQPWVSADPSPAAHAAPAPPAASPEPAPAPARGSGAGEQRQLTFTSSQAARYLGVSLATIRRWTDAGHVDCYRTPGGQRRFSKDQLDGFVDSLQGGQSHPSRRAA